jgi:signal transduction histidine kinase
MALEIIRFTILILGWPLLTVGGAYILYRAWDLYVVLGKTPIARLIPIMSIAVVVTMFSLGVVATVLLYTNINVGVVWVVPVFILWFISLCTLLITAAQYDVHAREYTIQQNALARAKDDLLAMASHQLRTPLSGMRWALSMLLSSPTLPSDIRPRIQALDSANTRLIELVNNILSTLTLETGQMSVHRTPHSLREIVESVVHELEPIASEKNMRVIQSSYTKDCTIETDRVLLFEVLSNVLANSIFYGTAGSDIHIECVTDPTRYIALSVTNQGSVIAPEHLPHVFEKFSREQHEGQEVIQNIGGLGMYIAKSFIVLLGGSIDVRSSAQEGTTFTLHLPVHEITIHAPASK